MADSFDPDTPELRLMAQLAGIAPSRLAATFNDPEHFTQHLSANELKRLQESWDRLALVQGQMLEALSAAAQALRGAMN